MKNQKVYLAKSTLASGLDFEYVKSSLLRIPNIEIIEYGDGYLPSECTCVVYVHDNITAVQEDHALSISKNVYNAIEEFVSQSEDGSAINGIFIYLGKSYASKRDVETTTPFMIPAFNYGQLEENTWDEYGILSIEAPEGICLLESVSYAMDLTNLVAWELNPRHDQPEEKYSLPAIPSLAERKSKGSKRNSTSIEVSAPQKSYTHQIPHPKKVKTSSLEKFVELTNHSEDIEEEEEEDTTFTFNGISADEIIASRKPKRRH